MIKTEKELLKLIWKEMGLGGHNADLKKRTVIAKEVHKAVKFGLEDCPPKRSYYIFKRWIQNVIVHCRMFFL